MPTSHPLQGVGRQQAGRDGTASGAKGATQPKPGGWGGQVAATYLSQDAFGIIW